MFKAMRDMISSEALADLVQVFCAMTSLAPGVSLLRGLVRAKAPRLPFPNESYYVRASGSRDI